MGSDFRIVEVGNNILQFKFSLICQLEWVEKSGPWNLDNNLLLLCRWRCGLSTANITFSHSPLWVQIWGLPFKHMTEEVGNDIGSKLGRVTEVEKRSMQADHAKFLRVRVDLPIEKPRRRGGYITNAEGDRVWVTFRYERLPTFCYDCGKLGHDGKHCSKVCESQLQDRQYGEWLRAGNVAKGTSEEIRGGGHRSKETLSGGDSGMRSQSSAEDVDISGKSGLGFQKFGKTRNFESREVMMKERHDGRSEAHAASYQSRWDSSENVEFELRGNIEACDGQVRTKETLVRELFKNDKEGVTNVGQTKKPNKEKVEVRSPLKTKVTEESKEKKDGEIGLGKGKSGPSKGKLKKIAREIGKAHKVSMKVEELSVGRKRIENTDVLAESEGGVYKRVYEGKDAEEMTVAARQHRRE